MKIIKMIKGMTVVNGKQFSVGDGAFQIDDEAKAARLVKLGVAEYADGAKVQTSSNDDTENNSNGNDENNGNETDIDSMSYNELKEKATELGIVYPGKKKADLIAEIKAVLAGDNGNGDNNVPVLADDNGNGDNNAPTFAPEGNIQ